MTYTENRTLNRSFRIFDCYDIDAQSGDYIAVPGYEILKVLSRTDSGDYINLVVQSQSGNNKPYQIDLLKPEIELAEQERSRIEADEAEMSAIIHSTATEEFQVYLNNLVASGKYDWLAEPIGTNPDAIFGKFVEPSNEEIATYPVAATGYHDKEWTSDDCEF